MAGITKHSKEELEERYKKLPEVLKEALFSVEVAEKIFEAGKKSGLNIDKIGELAEETGYVVLGLTGPKEFIKNLQERLNTPTDKTMEIAKEINHQVFFPLREELKKAHNMDLAAEDFQKSEPLVRGPVAIPPPSPATQTRPTLPMAPKPSTSPPPATFPRPAPPPSPITQVKPAPPPPPIEKKEMPARGPLPMSLSPIILDKKPELNLPPSKIPPIDLRAQTKEVAPPPAPPSLADSASVATSAKEAASYGGQSPPKEREGERPKSTPPTAPPQPPERKMPYGGGDPYKEPIE